MFKSMSNLIFLSTLLIESIIMISSNNLLGASTEFEINFLSFIPLTIIKKVQEPWKLD